MKTKGTCDSSLNHLLAHWLFNNYGHDNKYVRNGMRQNNEQRLDRGGSIQMRLEFKVEFAAIGPQIGNSNGMWELQVIKHCINELIKGLGWSRYCSFGTSTSTSSNGEWSRLRCKYGDVESISSVDQRIRNVHYDVTPKIAVFNEGSHRVIASVRLILY